MLLLHAQNVKKYYGDRFILEFDDLKVYDGDRIGIVGLNGAGKTTLMEILTGNITPDEGNVRRFTDLAYIKQFGTTDNKTDGYMAKEFGIKDKDIRYLSGGERTRLKIANQLDKTAGLLFADEPTSNLDIDGISLIEKKFMKYNGALLLISHDRELLDKLCNSILEIENGKVKCYLGNYSSYKQQKDAERERQEFEYEQYVNEKKKLETTINALSNKAGSIKKAPKRMGNSEARLHKRNATEKQEKLHKSVKDMQTRLEKLEIKDKPRALESIKIEFNPVSRPGGKILIKGEDISLSFGNRVLFNKLNFEVANDSKTALIGKNGVGKTTLIKMIISGHPKIKVAAGAQIAYFSQEMEMLDPNQTILENVMKGSRCSQWMARTILARLLFKRDDVYKKVAVLSGGERVKLSIAKLLLSDANLLILDEPTNYLDLFSMETLQSVLKEYEGTMLFTSHDRRFVDSIADRIIIIDNGTAKMFDGNYTEYLNESERAMSSKNTEGNIKRQEEELILRMRLASIAGKLSKPGKNDNVEQLDAEFKRIVSQLKDLNGKTL